MKSLLLIVCGGVAFYCALQNLDTVAAAIGWLLGIFAPFLLGGAIAFVLNVPMSAIERHRLAGKGKFRRPLALILTLLCVAGVLALASWVIAPGVAEAMRSIPEQLPAAQQQAQAWLTALENYLPQLETLLAEWEMDWNSLSQKAVGLLQSWGGALVSSGGRLMAGLVSGVSTFVIGLVFSFYILLRKESLARQGRQCLYALLPEPAADETLKVLRLTGKTFSSFLSGQCLEACILGSMFAVSMAVLRMPYALLVGVLIALTALIPIVGAFIGCAVGFLLIAITDLWKALAFVALFLVLQQVEGNLIYPHVVGSSVGLPSIWVLAAVTVGGKLFGIPGMLIFIPLCSVLYALFRRFILNRLDRRHVPAEKWE